MQVLTRIECPNCNGSGIVYIPGCDLCGERFSEEQMNRLMEEIHWMSPGKPSLPCLCSFDNLNKEYTCSDCEGTGHQELWLDLEELVNQVISGWVTATGTPLKRIG